MSHSNWLSSKDPNSYANIEDVTVTHLDLELDVDFDKKILKGSATLTLDRKNPTATDLVSDLTIYYNIYSYI